MIVNVELFANAKLDNERLNVLFSAAWPSQQWRDFDPVLARSLVYVSASIGERLVGFVNVATDGGGHAFLLDPTVHPQVQRRGIGLAMVHRAIDEARRRGASWVPVDFVSDLERFYRTAGFQMTHAGIFPLQESSGERKTRQF